MQTSRPWGATICSWCQGYSKYIKWVEVYLTCTKCLYPTQMLPGGWPWFDPTRESYRPPWSSLFKRLNSGSGLGLMQPPTVRWKSAKNCYSVVICWECLLVAKRNPCESIPALNPCWNQKFAGRTPCFRDVRVLGEHRVSVPIIKWHSVDD